MQLIYEKSVDSRKGFKLPESDIPCGKNIDTGYLRKNTPCLPEVSELDVVRHYTNLSRMNFSVDNNFYPLGSCTMKYNPKFTEKIANMEGFLELHPLMPQLLGGGRLSQGSLEVIYNTEKLPYLCPNTKKDQKEKVYITIHQRNWRYLETGKKAENIEIRHLWLIISP